MALRASQTGPLSPRRFINPPILGCLVLSLYVLNACSNSTSDPADPNSATVAGIDADSNGVRDDVDRYIDDTYPGGSNGPTRHALRQYARAAGAAMVDASNAALSIMHGEERFRAIDCLMANRPEDFPTVFSDIRARILNTDARTKAYLQADGQVTANTPAILPADQLPARCTAS